jgi:hypothetical protein
MTYVLPFSRTPGLVFVGLNNLTQAARHCLTECSNDLMVVLQIVWRTLPAHGRLRACSAISAFAHGRMGQGGLPYRLSAQTMRDDQLERRL